MYINREIIAAYLKDRPFIKGKKEFPTNEWFQYYKVCFYHVIINGDQLRTEAETMGICLGLLIATGYNTNRYEILEEWRRDALEWKYNYI